MKRTNNVSLINIIMAMIALLCLLLSTMGTAGAWFTSNGSVLKIETITVGNIAFYLKQGETIIDSNNNYISTSGEIKPDIAFTITNGLKIVNEDQGNQTYYTKFKFEIYANGRPDVLIADVSDITFTGADTFTKSGDYMISNTAIGTGESLTMLTAFTIPYSCFVDSDGQPIFDAETVKIVVTIEGSETAY